MTSEIKTSNIDETFPVPGRDNDSQGFRSNFSNIKTALETARDEIEYLQVHTADLTKKTVFENLTPSVSTGTGAIVVYGGVGIGDRLYVDKTSYIGGAEILTTSTLSIINSATSEVTVTGPYNKSDFRVSSSLSGVRTLTGYQTINGLLYVATTASNSTNNSTGAVFVANNGSNDAALRLAVRTTDADQNAGYGTQSFIDFRHSITGQSVAGTSVCRLTMAANGKLAFTETVKFAHGALLAGAPASATDTGIAGQMAVDGSYVYVCTATNAWIRISLSGYTW